LRLRAAALALRVGGSQAQIDAHGLSWPQRERIMSRGFRSNIRRIHSSGIVLDDGIVDTILDIRRCAPNSVQPAIVRLIFCEQQLWSPFEVQPTLTISRVIELNHMLVPAGGWAGGCAGGGSHERTRLILVPCPGVSKPDGREQIQ